MGQMKPGAKWRDADVPRARRQQLSEKELDARLHDAAVELRAVELPSLARGVEEARRRLAPSSVPRAAAQRKQGQP